jgi:hypothetical protein
MPHPQSRARRVFFVLASVLLLASLTIGVALAHEHRHVGPYELVVGWGVEPALVEQPNSLTIRIIHTGAEHPEAAATEGEHESTEHEEGATHEHAEAQPQPMTGLEGSLKAEVTFGDKTMPLQLRAAFGQPGLYIADLLPTRPGSYIFHITGEISGTQLDEQFNSADGEFSDVEPLASVQFPEPVSPAADLQTQLTSAQQAANTARLLALAGLVTGVLGLAAGGFALARR